MSEFELSIRLPDAKNIKIGTFVSDMMYNAIKEQKIKESRSRRKSGAWGTVCKWFGTSDWGWEDYDVEVDIFVIDMKTIFNDTIKGFKTIFQNLESSALHEIKQGLEDMTNSFFDALRDKVERVRGDLLSGLDDKKQSEEIKKSLVSALTELEKPIPGLLRDSEELSDQVNDLLSNESRTEVA